QEGGVIAAVARSRGGAGGGIVEIIQAAGRYRLAYVHHQFFRLEARAQRVLPLSGRDRRHNVIRVLRDIVEDTPRAVAKTGARHKVPEVDEGNVVKSRRGLKGRRKAQGRHVKAE